MHKMIPGWQLWEYTRITMLVLRRSREATANRDTNNIRTDIYRTDKILRFSLRNIITLVRTIALSREYAEYS